MTTTPALGPVSSGFGKRKSLVPGMSTNHKGTDLGVPVGTPVVAPQDGVVTVSRYSPVRGHYVTVSHGDGTATLHQHLSKRLVAEGQRVEEGELIGLSGRSGIATGPHLHTEVQALGIPVDPVPWYLAKGVILGSAIRVAAGRIIDQNGDTVFGIVLVHPVRGHVLIGPVGAHKLTGEEWNEAVGPKMRDRGLVEVIDLTAEGDVGLRRFDLLLAALTQTTA